MEKYRLKIIFEEITGDCNVHEEGDQFIIESDGQTLRLGKDTEKICIYALSGIVPVLSAMTKDLSDEDWMSKKERILQCMNPGAEREGSGTAYMKIKRKRVKQE
ncbi:hypothetical protein AKJ49_01945 [candidate division MSBL1 archaeon SCGC-AAA382A03]|uniref:TIGR04076 family protein n=1 Tax=candidate division MSBL1 archaeon SCGC-AAA382A03 TaxID=1698278 RepID=A0A133VDR8_9EURY|nr:hypothetical protein AKJ49_01945 [candidate division MSBL1 archaeon SCGC-AAA382A03]